MSEQEIFDTVYRHMLTQGRKASPDGLLCRYRTVVDGNVLTCAVGCLIPDSEYKPTFEGKCLERIIDSGYCPRWLTQNLAILHELQVIHDHYLVLNWPIRLAELAVRRGLTIPQIQVSK